jgi:hypothetical protein
VNNTTAKQRCIGHQRLANGALASVIETVWPDGTIEYHVTYLDPMGFHVSTPPTRFKPHVDIPADEHST